MIVSVERMLTQIRSVMRGECRVIVDAVREIIRSFGAVGERTGVGEIGKALTERFHSWLYGVAVDHLHRFLHITNKI